MSDGSSIVPIILSSFMIRTSKPSTLNRFPAYLPIIIQLFSLHHAPDGNLSLSLYASGPSFTTYAQTVENDSLSLVASGTISPPFVFSGRYQGITRTLYPVG